MARTVEMPNGNTMTVSNEGYVSGEVSFDLNELLGGIENLNDLAGERLIGLDLLEDISYEPLRVEDGQVVLTVTGDPRQALDCHYGGEEGDIPWQDALSPPSP